MSSILVIDDDQDVRRSVSAILSKLNYRVYTATDGDDGLKQFKEKLPDLVITDIIMPRIEGLELIQAVKSIQPEQKIIAMSGGGSNHVEYLSAAKIFGAATTLYKPFNKFELLDRVNLILNVSEQGK